jgi:hypothetical protein
MFVGPANSETKARCKAMVGVPAGDRTTLGRCGEPAFIRFMTHDGRTDHVCRAHAKELFLDFAKIVADGL